MRGWNEFHEALKKVLSESPQYREEAYYFVMRALNRAVSKLSKPGHVKGQELLEALLQEAREEFGPMAITVLNYWGIKNSLDFGNIVFNMVGAGILIKQDSDVLKDFECQNFFDRLFDDQSEYQLYETELKTR